MLCIQILIRFQNTVVLCIQILIRFQNTVVICIQILIRFQNTVVICIQILIRFQNTLCIAYEIRVANEGIAVCTGSSRNVPDFTHSHLIELIMRQSIPEEEEEEDGVVRVWWVGRRIGMSDEC